MILGVGGHIGDAVIATSLLPLIRAANPEMEIGIATGSWCRDVFVDHPLVSRVHIIDHWRMNRARQPLLSLVRHWLRTRRHALREIAAVGYDASIDLYPYYPNMTWTFAAARIPIRAGYPTGGGGARLTRPSYWDVNPSHISANGARLVSTVMPIAGMPFRYDLPPLSDEVGSRAATMLAAVTLPIAVLHPGAGHRAKEWSLEEWRAVATELLRRFSVVITGAGAREVAMGAVLGAIPGVIDLTGRTSLNEARAIFQRAAVVVASDSAAGHLAAGEGTPIVTVMTNPTDAPAWRPLTARGVVLRGSSLNASSVIEAARSIAHEA